jgi:amidase
MAHDREFAALDALAQAELVRRREASPLDLVEAAIARIERLNPRLNAVVTPLFEEACRVARGPLPDGPFAGVPFLLKDLTAAYAGAPLTSGSRFMSAYVPDADAEIVRRFRRAGLIIVGKTNTPEFGVLPTTEPALFGPTRNPWAPERTPGGSSGGSAVAVATGMVAAAHANDGGGSIRIPAACCGLFGLKPTRGRVPLPADAGDVAEKVACDHVVTRSVRDSAALLDAISEPRGSGFYLAPPPERPFRDEVGRDPGRLRILFTTAAPGGTPVHPDCVAVVEDAARLCASLGHEVAEAPHPLADGRAVARAFSRAWAVNTAWTIERGTLLRGRPPEQDELEPLTWALYDFGRGQDALDLLRATTTLADATRELDAFFARCDVWLTPVVGEPPPPLGSFAPAADDPLAGYRRAGTFAPFTALANISGRPAMSVPLYWNAEGIPIGSHFVGRYGDEATLLRLAAQLETARPWAGRTPPLP